MLKKVRKFNGAENEMFRIEIRNVNTEMVDIISKINNERVSYFMLNDINVRKRLMSFGFDYQPLQTLSLPELECFADENMLSTFRKPCGAWMFIPLNEIIPLDAEGLLNENGYTLKI